MRERVVFVFNKKKKKKKKGRQEFPCISQQTQLQSISGEQAGINIDSAVHGKPNSNYSEVQL